MTDKEAMTQDHDEELELYGDCLTQEEAEAEFGRDWTPPYCWPADEVPSEEEVHAWGVKLGIMDP